MHRLRATDLKKAHECVWQSSCLIHTMNNGEKLKIDEKEWRRLCQLVAAEPDPQRLSELVDQLLKELDARREALLESER
jgi:hypothetical protein